jgi:hypothetical protein
MKFGSCTLALMLLLSCGSLQNTWGHQASSGTSPKRSVASPFKDYVGRYEVESKDIPITTIDVTLAKDELWAKPSFGVKRKLVAQSKTEFVDASENSHYTFLSDQGKKIVGLTFEYRGKTYTARKLELSAPSLRGNVEFRLSGYPSANLVVLAGSFNNWNQSQILFAKQRDGWICRIKLQPGKYLYKFIVDGNWITDPSNPNVEADSNGNVNSVLIVKP